MKYILLLLTSTIILFISGCTSTKQLPKQNIKLPKSFSITGTQTLQSKWWETFEDSELNRLIESALASNLSLQATWERLTQARAIAIKSGASLYPNLSLSNEISTTKNHGSTNNFSSGVAASYEIDLWGRLNSQADASLFELKASHESLLSASISLSAEVASTWYRLKEQHSHAILLDNQILLNEKHLKLTQRKFRSAQAKASDILQQRQVLESVKGEAILTNGRIKLFEHQLALLLGVNAGTLKYSKESNLTVKVHLPKIDIASEFLMQRPDVKAAYYKLQAYDKLLANAVAEQYPKFTISASLRSNSISANELFTNWLLTLIGNISAPLFDAGMRRAEVDKRVSQRDEQFFQYSYILLNALKDVEDSLSKVTHQQRYVDSLNRQVELSNSSLKQIREQYIHANTSFISFLNAQLSHKNLQRNQISASRELIENKISLNRALASGWTLIRKLPTVKD